MPSASLPLVQILPVSEPPPHSSPSFRMASTFLTPLCLLAFLPAILAYPKLPLEERSLNSTTEVGGCFKEIVIGHETFYLIGQDSSGTSQYLGCLNNCIYCGAEARFNVCYCYPVLKCHVLTMFGLMSQSLISPAPRIIHSSSPRSAASTDKSCLWERGALRSILRLSVC